MKVIAVTGLIGSGKDEVARYLVKRHGFTLYDHSALLGEVLRKQGRPPTREEKRKLRKERGPLFTARLIIQKIREEQPARAVIGSLRRPEEIRLTRQAFPGTRLLLVKASPRVRFRRASHRARDAPRDWVHFLEEERKEEKQFHFTETFRHADFSVANNSSLRALQTQLDHIVERL